MNLSLSPSDDLETVNWLLLMVLVLGILLVPLWRIWGWRVRARLRPGLHGDGGNFFNQV